MIPPSSYPTPMTGQVWLRQVEQALEAGQTPLLELGLNQRLLDGWAAQLALHHFVQTRTDILTPSLLIGGNSPLWSVLLLQPEPSAGGASAPPLHLLYGGADQATYLASVTTLAAERLLAAGLQVDALPASMAPGLAPLTNPSVPLPWAAMSLALLPVPHPAPPTLEAEPTPPVDPWLAWSTLGLVMLLVLLALFV